MRYLRACTVIPLLAALLAGCDGWQSTGTEDNGSLSVTQLKYRLDTRYTVFFCDPDLWPVVRGDEPERALQRFPEIAANPEKLLAILEHLGLAGRTDLTPAEKLSIYREDKRLVSITLEPLGSIYSFQLRASEGQDVNLVRGEIDPAGRITVRSRTSTVGTCPICLSGDTYITTANGPVRVRDLRKGDLVYSLNDAQQRVLTPVLRLMRVPAPLDHQFIRLRLADGRELLASPGHPTSDGRLIRELVSGDRLDGSRVSAVERVTVQGEAATYDLLPAGSTGVYWANGVLLGSTLFSARVR